MVLSLIFPICIDPTGSHETKILASKTMIIDELEIYGHH